VKTKNFLAAFLILAASCAVSHADYVAFQAVSTASDTVGSNVTIGKDFDTVQAIQLTGLGVFDPGGSIPGTITISLYDRDTDTIVPGAIATISGTQGINLDGHRIITLAAPITLAANFHGSVVVSNATSSYSYGTAGTTNDTGGGLISIAYPPDTYRFTIGGTPGLFPGSSGFVTDPNIFAVGTFTFTALTVPEPSSVALMGLGVIASCGYGLRRFRQRTTA